LLQIHSGTVTACKKLCTRHHLDQVITKPKRVQFFASDMWSEQILATETQKALSGQMPIPTAIWPNRGESFKFDMRNCEGGGMAVANEIVESCVYSSLLSSALTMSYTEASDCW